MKSPRAIPVLFLLLACPAARLARAQGQPPPKQQAPHLPAPQEPTFDPYHAEKSVEVGLFYMKKGNYDAAIERFEDATRFKPSFARPYLLLGEAHEKNGENAEAVQSYQKYLEILPSAGDAARVRKRIARLTRELERAARRRP